MPGVAALLLVVDGLHHGDVQLAEERHAERHVPVSHLELRANIRHAAHSSVLNLSVPLCLCAMSSAAVRVARASFARGVRGVHTERRLEELGIILPPVTSPVANYKSVIRSGNMLFTGGLDAAPLVSASRRCRLR